MKEWSVADAKAQFSTVLHDAAAEPQVIRRRDLPVAVVVGMETYAKVSQKKRLSVPQMLRKLRAIQATETAEIDVPPRADRAAAAIED